MDECERYLSEIRFDLYDKTVKTSSRSIKWDKGYIALCLFNSISFGLSAFKGFSKNEILSSSLFILASIAWMFVIFLTIRTIKEKRIDLSRNAILRDEELKKLDYTKYIKNQRKEKLKKLKKSNWFS